MNNEDTALVEEAVFAVIVEFSSKDSNATTGKDGDKHDILEACNHSERIKALDHKVTIKQIEAAIRSLAKKGQIIRRDVQLPGTKGKKVKQIWTPKEDEAILVERKKKDAVLRFNKRVIFIIILDLTGEGGEL